MKFTYDKEADAAYIYFLEKQKSVKTYGDWPLHVDVNEDGAVIGIEVMDASKVLNEEYIKKHTL